MDRTANYTRGACIFFEHLGHGGHFETKKLINEYKVVSMDQDLSPFHKRVNML